MNASFRCLVFAIPLLLSLLCLQTTAGLAQAPPAAENAAPGPAGTVPQTPSVPAKVIVGAEAPEIDRADKTAAARDAADRDSGRDGSDPGISGGSGRQSPFVEPQHHLPLGEQLAALSLAPFALLLFAIAAMPIANPHWWESHKNKSFIVLCLSLPILLYLTAFGETGWHEMGHKLREYVSFVLLIGSLFVITGGVYVRGTFSGRPASNAAILGFGAVIASLVGTTGASMLLIRPLLRANARRTRVVHVVIFFIFVVSNCGGLLTPLGDPPLFLGFLSGVPFAWTLRLWPQWLFVNGALLAIFFVWDAVRSRGESIPDSPAASESIGIEGGLNLLWLAGVVAVVYASGQGIGNGGETWPWGVAELLMLGLTALAWFTTAPRLRVRNQFSFSPIVEVAVLFAGIFITMIPALAILNANGKYLEIEQPWQYFWMTGFLSSFLDNAPTYMTFAATAAGAADIPAEGRFLETFLASSPVQAAEILAAISCGAVFMGANTYIGNGPNFMVKAIAEENNVRMPSFFGYLFYSVAVLLPLFLVATLLFFGR